MLREEGVVMEGDMSRLLDTEPTLNRSHHDVICIHPESLASVFYKTCICSLPLPQPPPTQIGFMVCVTVGLMAFGYNAHSSTISAVTSVKLRGSHLFALVESDLFLDM